MFLFVCLKQHVFVLKAPPFDRITAEGKMFEAFEAVCTSHQKGCVIISNDRLFNLNFNVAIDVAQVGENCLEFTRLLEEFSNRFIIFDT